MICINILLMNYTFKFNYKNFYLINRKRLETAEFYITIECNNWNWFNRRRETCRKLRKRNYLEQYIQKEENYDWSLNKNDEYAKNLKRE